MLDPFFNLGFNRAFRRQVPIIALLLSCSLSLADWSSSDSSILSDIDQNVADILSYLESHSTDTSVIDIRNDTSELRYTLFPAQLEQMTYLRNSVNSLKSPLDIIAQRVGMITNQFKTLNSKIDSGTVYRSGSVPGDTGTQSVYVHDVRNDDIYDRLGQLNDSINNLTNYMSFSSGSSGVVNTNLPAILGYVPDDPSFYNSIDYFYQLYGRYPVWDELVQFETLIYTFGFGNWVSLLKNLDISYANLPDGMFPDIAEPISLYYPYPLYEEYADQLSGARYYQYGTRDLTVLTGSLTNLVSQINSRFSNFLQNVEGDTTHVEELNNALNQPITVYESSDSSYSVRNNSVIVNAVSDLSEDFIGTLPSISTNLVQANTNAIVNISDDSYQAALNDIQNATPDNTPSEFDTVLTDLNAEEFTGDLISVLEQSTDECVFTFDLSGFNLVPSRTRDIPQGLVNFTLTDVKRTTNDYVNFFCGFMECILCLFFGAMLWNLIFDSAIVFYK